AVGLAAPLFASAPASAAPLTVTQAAHADQAARVLPTALTKNKIYRSGTPDVSGCSPSAPQNGSAASVRRFLGQVRTCLNRLWAREFARVGLKFRAPKVVVSTTLTRSPCRRLTVTTPAHYCPTLQTIYFRLLKAHSKHRSPL